MLKLMIELNFSLEDVLNTLDEVFDIVVSDVDRIDEVLTDSMINEIYFMANHCEVTWSELVNRKEV